MAKNKKSDQSSEPDEQKALEQRVDAMMDPANPRSNPTPAGAPDQSPPEIDIFNDPKTAPQVSPELLKQIGVKNKPSAEPEKPSEPKPHQPQLAKYRPAASITPAPVPKPAPEKPAETAAEPQLENSEKPVTETPGPTTESEPPAGPESTDLDSPETDKAVDDIAVKESDEVLAAEDVIQHRTADEPPAKSGGWRNRLAKLPRRKGFWIVILAVVVVLAALPAPRYRALGLVIKKPVTVTVLDSTTHTPVSNAEISLRGKQAKTNGSGVATLKVPVGSGRLDISKQYYKPYNQSYFVALSGDHTSQVKLTATGRQVPIVVVNKISGQTVANAEIKVLNTTAKTDNKGKAQLVLPAGKSSEKAVVTAAGFIAVNSKVKITASAVPENTFQLTPTGKVYFLSNLSGHIDVVKTNLDGSERQTVLAGTGREDAQTTSLLASRDWRFLVLEARRETAQAILYIIDTKTDKVSKLDSDTANFQLIGWYGHNFVYDKVSTTMDRWQPGREQLKSYDADKDDLHQLDQNQAEGNGSSYAYQSFENFYLLDNLVAYSTHWYTFDSGGTGYDLGNKTGSIRGITPTGQNKKDYQTFDAKGVSSIQAVLYEPQAVYYSVYNYLDNKSTSYKLENGKVAPANLDPGVFNKPYPTYLVSPDGKQTFWSELLDGKNALFVGDTNANNKKQVASLNNYAPYGWFTNSYLLVTKNSSELYIIPTGGLPTGKQPLKITDYYKPAPTFTGYGYGYGGL